MKPYQYLLQSLAFAAQEASEEERALWGTVGGNAHVLCESFRSGAEAMREICAKTADRYEDQINGTQDFRNGWIESAESIEETIKVSPLPEPEKP
jgi:hypothetical protein